MKQRERRSVREKVFGVVAVALVGLLLGACQTNQGPSAEELATAFESGLDAAGFKQDESLRVRFQPPIGNARPVRDELAEDANLELVAFNLDANSGEAYGQALPPALSTATKSLSFDDGVYSAVWDVSLTAAEATGDYVRIEIRPAGIPQEQVCNDPWGACLGYVDARIVRTGKPGRSVAAQEIEITAAGKKLKNTITVPDHAMLPVNFKLLAGDVSLEDLSGLSALVALGRQGDKLDKAGNCSADDFSRPGQGLQAVGAGLQAVGAGLQAVGAVGGLFVADTVRLADPEPGQARVTTNAHVAEQLLSQVTPDLYGPKVAVLIVDSFNEVYALPEALLGSADLGPSGLEDLQSTGTLSHGALVFHQAKQLAAAVTGDANAWPRVPNAKEAKFHFMDGPYKGSPLLIRAVDAAALNTDGLAELIRGTIEDVSAKGYKQVVVNMSFAIVPCAITEDVAKTIGTGTIPTFEDYVASLLLVNAVRPGDQDALAELAGQPLSLDSDPFFRYLDCPLPDVDTDPTRCDGKSASSAKVVESLVHVAASGNFANDYALYPAALPTVISVGSLDVATTGYSPRRSAFSNAATVLAPGALFGLSTKTTQQIVYAGTSFAAPVVSLFAALDLIADEPLCDAGSTARYPPVAHDLASTSLSDSPLVPSFLGTAPDAVARYCYNPE